MKARFLSILASIILLAGCQDAIEPQKRVNEVPDNIIPTKPCKTLYSRIIELVPEYRNNEELQFILFSDTVQKKVLLTRETEL